MHILHLSDLHFSQNNYELTNLLNEVLIPDLSRLGDNIDKPDFVVFSGDLVHDPDEKDVYYLFGDYLEKILDALSLDASHVVFCPGNHDVSRRKITEKKAEIGGISLLSEDEDDFSKIYSAGNMSNLAYELSSPFFEFCEFFEQKWSDPFYCVKKCVDGQAFLALNTSFSCSFEGSGKDRGKLVFPLAALERGLSLSGEHDLFVLMHHPLHEFAEQYFRVMNQRISNTATAVMFGHVHNARPTLEKSPGSDCFFLQSGALYERPKIYSGYCLYSRLKDGHVARFRTFQAGRGEFDIGVDVAKNGLFFPTDADQKAWESRITKVLPEKLNSHLREKCLSECNEIYGNNIVQQDLYERYVFPYFGTDGSGKIDEESGIEGSEIRFTEKDIKKSEENIFAFFPEECGATSFLSYLALDMCKNPEDYESARIPILLDISVMRPYPAHIESMVRSAMPCSDDSEFGWRALKESHPFLFLVDNFLPSNDRHQRVIEKLTDSFESARFIIAVKTPLAIHAKALPKLGVAMPGRNVVLHPFSRRQVRALVEKSDLPDDMDRNLVVDDIATRFTTIGIPLSGPIITMYLYIIKQKGKYAPVNAALVLENFVEAILEKIDSSIFREDFDYGEQVNVLCEVAKLFIMKGFISVTYELMYEKISEYYSSVGIERTANQVIEYFLEKKIFEQIGQDIYFRHGIFLTYLTAKEMIKDEEFFGFCTTKSNCCRFVNEIDIYFGLKRNDLRGLEKISGWYEEAKNEVLKEVSELADPETLSDLSLPTQKDMHEFMGEVSRRVLSSDSGAEADEELDGDVTSRKQFKQKISRPIIQNRILQYIHLLRAYSVAIKNLEDIPREKKEYHLQRVINGWALVTAFSVRLFALLFEDGEVKTGDTTFVFDDGRQTDGRQIRMLMANIPTVVSNVVRAHVGTEKLNLQLKSVGENAVESFLAQSLRLDMRLPEILTDVRRTLAKSKGEPIVLEFWMWKLRDSFMRFGLGEIDTAQFRRLIAEADADVLGLKGSDRSDRISETLQRVDKRRLVRNQNL